MPSRSTRHHPLPVSMEPPLQIQLDGSDLPTTSSPSTGDRPRETAGDRGVDEQAPAPLTERCDALAAAIAGARRPPPGARGSSPPLSTDSTEVGAYVSAHSPSRSRATSLSSSVSWALLLA